ncbi:hypothetical protein [Streptomyces sp. NPDC002746]
MAIYTLETGIIRRRPIFRTGRSSHVWWGWPVRDRHGEDRAAAVRTAVGGGQEVPGAEPDPMLMMPPSLEDWLPQDHLARFVADLIDEVLDLSSIRAAYRRSVVPGPPG